MNENVNSNQVSGMTLEELSSILCAVKARLVAMYRGMEEHDQRALVQKLRYAWCDIDAGAWKIDEAIEMMRVI